jgi:hypothetical protein
MYTSEALLIFIFLTPGFISSAIMNFLVVREDKKELTKIVEALAFSLIIYTIYAILHGQSPVILDSTSGTVVYNYDAVGFLWLAGITLLIPIAISYCITNDLHMKLARILRITTKTARPSIWLDVFYNNKKHIIIDFENGRRLYGWPMYYSDNPKEPYLFLYKPYWVQEKKFIDTEVYGMLITPEQKIDIIEILNE